MSGVLFCTSTATLAIHAMSFLTDQKNISPSADWKTFTYFIPSTLFPNVLCFSWWSQILKILMFSGVQVSIENCFFNQCSLEPVYFAMQIDYIYIYSKDYWRFQDSFQGYFCIIGHQGQKEQLHFPEPSDRKISTIIFDLDFIPLLRAGVHLICANFKGAYVQKCTS